MFYNATSEIFRKAELLRNNPTETEIILWKHLRKGQMGVKFRRQHPLGYYIVDFYCHKLKFVIELDGEYHQSNFQKEKDNYKDKFLKENGIKIFRFTDEEVKTNLERVLEKIKFQIQELTD